MDPQEITDQADAPMDVDADAQGEDVAGVDRAADPFFLGDEGLFKSLVCKRAPSGEAFVGYKLLGQPLILSSRVDGLPIVALHLLVQEPYRGLMVTSGGEGEPFLGVVKKNN